MAALAISAALLAVPAILLVGFTHQPAAAVRFISRGGR